MLELYHEEKHALSDEAALPPPWEAATDRRPTHGTPARSAAVRGFAPGVGAPLKSLLNRPGRSMHRASRPLNEFDF
jgi:hypothetical protein